MRKLVLALLGLTSCQGLSDRDAAKLVETYNARVIEAFRAGDPRLVEPVTGATDGRRIAALIGVKLDMGITLDSRLLDLTVLSIERGRGEVVVHTEERWHYRDRKVGTGEQVGEDSTDHYFVRYHLRKPEGRWVVDEIAFDREPVVGRREAPLSSDVRTLHGMPPVASPPEPGGPGAPRGTPAAKEESR
jgi:hypothetical protein